MRLRNVLFGFVSTAVWAAPSLPRTVPVQTWRGILVDAGCRDRSLSNLRRQPAAPAPTPAQNRASARAGISSHGITVNNKTLQAERGNVMDTHTPDHLIREAAESCALTGGTRGVALLLEDGTLLNLDEGGNTMALQEFQSSPEGMAVLNGQAAGQKPRAVIKGIRDGDEVVVSSIRLE